MLILVIGQACSLGLIVAMELRCRLEFLGRGMRSVAHVKHIVVEDRVVSFRILLRPAYSS